MATSGASACIRTDRLRGASPLEYDHRGLARTAAGVAVETGIEGSPPQPCPLCPGCSVGDDVAPAIHELNRRVRVGLEVEPPGRVCGCPAVHRQGHQVGAILEVAEDH